MYFMASFWDTIGDPFVELWRKMTDYGPRWLVALVIMVVAYIISRLVKSLVEKAVGRVSTEGYINILIARGASAVVLGIGVLLALSEIGMSLSGALAAVGLASVGIGFALKDVLGNLFAGITLLVQHPFTIGDQVLIGGQEGVVENVRVRDTQILTYAGERVYIPNQMVFENPIINYTSTPSLRLDVRVGVRYDEDLEKARRILKRIMEGTTGVLEQPEPAVLVETESECVVLVMRFWMGSDRNRRLKVKSDVRELAIKAFNMEGITIPYPIRTVEFYQPPEGGEHPDAGRTIAMKRVRPKNQD
ncbi:MAG: mechanosensitive ion channel [Actinobacteria bacterium]|nr:mechanosensitive ion channel [Actinomycetota bacterium]MBU4391413.1 mechanosensitive ion channel [Actinomycetota bacterium]MBU4401745.1 mechanosensitive ion channel [Actinomycetota bacterium]MBU4441394.1 mechanosensitive ion channel [Actinomycetota bacterium]